MTLKIMAELKRKMRRKWSGRTSADGVAGPGSCVKLEGSIDGRSGGGNIDVYWI